jgi:hypothetical protein
LSTAAAAAQEVKWIFNNARKKFPEITITMEEKEFSGQP